MMIYTFTTKTCNMMEKETAYSLGYLLDRTLWALSNSLNIALKAESIDLPHSQYIVLRTLFEKDGMSQNEIAAHLHKDAAAIKRTVDYLEQKELVTRKAVAHNKNNVFLTEKSIRLRGKILSVVDKVFADALSGISEEELLDGIRFLEKIYKSASEEKNK